MTTKDKTTKYLEDYNDVFADIINNLVLRKDYLQEDGLISGATESIYKAASGDLHNQFRDTIKHYQSSSLTLASFGIENQSSIEKYMPIRVMKYDCLSYDAQSKSDKALSPTLTVVLNFSNEPWSAPKSLHGLMDIPEELLPHIPDYPIHVYDIAYLEDDVIKRFTSDFKLVARFFKAKRISKDKLILNADKTVIKHVEAVMDLLRAFTSDERFTDIYDEVLKPMVEEGRDIVMCEVIDAYINKGRALGFAEGEAQGEARGKAQAFYSLVEDGSITIIRAALALNCTVEEVRFNMTTLGYTLPTAQP